MNKLIFELPCKHSVTLTADMDDAQAFMDGWNIQITCSSCNLTFEFNHSDGYLKSFKPDELK